MSTVQVHICDRCGNEARSDGNEAVFKGFMFVDFGIDGEARLSRHFCSGCVMEVGGAFKQQPRDFPVPVKCK